MKYIKILIILMISKLSLTKLYEEKDAVKANVFEIIIKSVEARQRIETVLIIDTCEFMKHEDVMFSDKAVLLYNDRSKSTYKKSNYGNMNNFIQILVMENSNTTLDQNIQKYYTIPDYEFETILVIYLSAVDENEEDFLEIIFKRCWQKNVMKVLIYFWSQTSDALQWYNYDVFTGTINNLTNNFDTRSFWKNLDLFGHELSVCLTENMFSTMLAPNSFDNYYGSDIYSLNALLEVLNATYKLQSWGRDCDIAFTKIDIITEKMHKRYLTTLDFDDWVISADKPGKMSDVVKYIKPFKTASWLAISATIAIFTLMLLIFKNIIFKFRIDSESYKVNVLEIASILLNHSLSIDTTKLCASMRILINTLVIFSFILSSCYLSVLYSYMLKPLYYKEMETLEEVYESGEKIILQDALKMFFGNTSIIDNKLYDLMVSPDEISEGMIVVRRRYMEFNILDLNNQGDTLYLIKECLMPTLVGYTVRDNFPFSRKIDRVLRNAQETGLTIIWERKAKYDFHTKRLNIHLELEDPPEENFDDEQILKISDFFGIFCAWGIGLLAASLVFVFEINLKRTINKSTTG